MQALTSAVMVKPGGTFMPILLICHMHSKHIVITISRASTHQGTVYPVHNFCKYGAYLCKVGSLSAEEALHVFSALAPNLWLHMDMGHKKSREAHAWKACIGKFAAAYRQRQACAS